jgi:hypothetical protein
MGSLMNTYDPLEYSLNRLQGEQFTEMTRDTAEASLRYFQDTFGLDMQKLADGDNEEWAKTRFYPPSYIMMIEQMMCKAKEHQ